MVSKQIKLFFIIGLFVTFLTKTYAQNDPINVIKINPLSLFVTNVSTFYERGLTPRSSAQVGINYMISRVFGIPISGYGVTLEYRYHTKKREIKTPRGFYVGPWARYQSNSLTGDLKVKDPFGHIQTISGSVSSSQSAVGGLVGFEIIGKKGFVVDFFLGPYYNYTSFSLSAGYSIISIPFFSIPTSGIGLRSGITLGYAF